MGACLLEPADQSTDASRLLSSADDALYEAKRGGRNRLVQSQGLEQAQGELQRPTQPGREASSPEPR